MSFPRSLLTSAVLCAATLFTSGAAWAGKPSKAALAPHALQVNHLPSGALTMHHADEQKGYFSTTLWKTRRGGTAMTETRISTDGKLTWKRESPTKFRPLARLTGSEIAKGELHYVAQDDGRSNIHDAIDAGRRLVAKSKREIKLHFNHQVIPIAP